MYKGLNHDRPHRIWCLQEPLMMCSLYKKQIYINVHYNTNHYII